MENMMCILVSFSSMKNSIEQMHSMLKDLYM